ncbi:MAG: 5-(carboxyamino)imidazole ribonucleotide mutase [Clostridiales bacterium]|nr:5-(carboxyamino)imidazole ribonucleotide mutase [Clostridiales bacterium]
MLKVLIIMGSDSDLPVMKAGCSFLEEIGLEYEARVSSAHRVPEKTATLAQNAAANGFGVIIAAAGMAAHLPGVIAAQTTLPVIGVPIRSEGLGGLDALYAIVQMPPGIPVATVAINGAKNAAILAAEILALNNPELTRRLLDFKAKMAREVEKKDQRLQEVGHHCY